MCNISPSNIGCIARSDLALSDVLATSLGNVERCIIRH